MRETLYSLIGKNKLRTVLFIIGFSIILGLVGYAAVNIFHWGTPGYILFGLIIVFYNLILYYTSDKVALAISGAKSADPETYYQLHNVVEELSIASGLPKPKVYVINDPSPNAFATGRNPKNASVAVTSGLLEMMNREELQGVIAHELSHIKNYDILLMTIVAIIGGLIILFRDIFLRSMFFMPRRRQSRRRGGGIEGILILAGIALAIIAPILVVLIRAAISREREYLADASGAYITRYPGGLADALEKIGGFSGKLRTASDATAHLFIANPFGKERRKVSSLLATHPPINSRIERLRKLEI